MISRDQVEQIRAAVDFVALVSERTQLKRSGVTRMVGCCPFHEERTPSFSINVDDKLFHCFGCGVGGDLFQYVQLLNGVEFPEAIEMLADRAGIVLIRQDLDPKQQSAHNNRQRVYELLDRAAKYYERQYWQSPAAQHARDYMVGRQLTEETCRKFRIGYSPDSFDQLVKGSLAAGFSASELIDAGLAVRSERGLRDRFFGRLMFPLCDRRGRVMGFGARTLKTEGPGANPKYLNSSEGVVFHKGSNVYAAHLARAACAKSGSVLLVEGYTDVMAMHQHGIDTAVGLMGTALTPGQVDELAALAPQLILCLDGDAAGRKAILRSLDVAAASRVQAFVAKLPPGSDPADLLAGQQEASELRQIVQAPVAGAKFQAAVLLEGAATVSASQKDQLITELAALLRNLPDGVLRLEILSDAAAELGVSATSLAEMVEARKNLASVTQTKARNQPVQADRLSNQIDHEQPPFDEYAAQVQPVTVAQRQEIEFLAACYACEDSSVLADAADRFDQLFSHPAIAAAARRLVARFQPLVTDAQASGGVGGNESASTLKVKTDSLTEQDPATVEIIRQIAASAMQIKDPDPVGLKLGLLRIELASTERAESDARRSGQQSAPLVERRLALRRQLDEELALVLARSTRLKAQGAGLEPAT